MHRLIAFNSSSNLIQYYELKQGIAPKYDGVLPSINRRSNSSHDCLAVSPDNNKVLLANTGTTNTPSSNLWGYDVEKYSIVQSATHFLGNIYCVATSNTHYAVGGSNPYLLLYQWQEQRVITIDTSGLGNVLSLCFNDNGNKLFVLHANAPYLRVYDLSDLSYQDTKQPVSISSSSSRISFFHKKLLFFGNTSSNFSYFKTFDENLEQIFSYNNTVNNKFFYGSIGADAIIQSPTTSGAVLYVSTYGIYELDIDTGNASVLHEFSNRPSNIYSCVNIDTHLLVSHSTSNGKSISAYRLSDWSHDETLSNLFDPLQNTHANLAIIKRDTAKLTGQVRDINNSPASRIIRAFDRTTGQIVAQTKSDTTGEYQLNLPTTDDVDVQFMAQDGENLPDLFYARVKPEPVS